MSDIIEVIKSRRNIKKFLPKFVSWENIARIIDAGRHAPSCGNLQNWKFIVIFDAETKNQVAEAAFEQYDIAMAAVLVVICAEPEKAERYYSERGANLYTIQNCAAATQNMLLEAHSLGLGGAWIGGFDEEAVKSICSIPEGVQAQAIVAIGYPKEVPEKPPKYPLETVTYFNRWRMKLRDPAKYMNDIATILARKASKMKSAFEGKIKSVVGKNEETPIKEVQKDEE